MPSSLYNSHECNIIHEAVADIVNADYRVQLLLYKNYREVLLT